MNRRVAAAGAGLAWLAVVPALAQSPVIRHEPLECVPEGMRARVTACIEPPEAVMAARLLFRPAGATEWQTLAMKREGGCFAAPLPKPPFEASTVSYLIEAVDQTMGVVRSPEARVPVRSRRQCAVAAAFSGPEPVAAAKPDSEKGAKRKKSPLLIAVVGGGVAAGVGAALMTRTAAQEPPAPPSPTPVPIPPPPSPTTTLPPPTTTRPPPNTTLPPPTTTTLPPPSTSTTLPSTTTTTTTTTSTLPTTTTTSTTTTTTTTTTLPTCTFNVAPDRTFSPVASVGECFITASHPNCTWRAQVVPGSVNWLSIEGDDSGRGTGAVRYRLQTNVGLQSRTARVELRENGAACTITQSGLAPLEGAAAEAIWTSHLDVVGGRGEVTVDGAAVRMQERGLSQGRSEPRPVHHLEARLVEGAGRPGVWRFEIGDSAVPGTLRPLMGNVIQLAGDLVMFRLEGRAGERVAFTWRTQ